MSSSQQTTLSGNLFDDNTITLTGGGDITIDLSANMASTCVLSNITTDTITISSGSGIISDYNISGYDFNWGDPKEFIDSFPSWQRIQDMCKKYPGLEVALKNFQTVYTLVKDDYDNQTPEE